MRVGQPPSTASKANNLVHDEITAKADSFYRGKSEASAAGARVVSGLRSGVFATIDACIDTATAKRKFQDNLDAITAFLTPLVGANILSESEARLGLASPKLSMLCKIGDYSDRLRHPRAVQYFLETGISGPTILYQFAVLFDKTAPEREDDARIELLVDTLTKRQARTRQDLLQLTREMKGSANDDISAKAAASVESAATLTGGDFDFVYSAPSPSEILKLREYYPIPPMCLRVSRYVAHDAIMVTVARECDLPVILDRLVPCCGFNVVSARIKLIRPPTGPDITEEPVVVAAGRGTIDPANSPMMKWSEFGEIDHIELATRFAPKASKRLVLFASAPVEGTTSIVGPANWEQSND